MATWLDISIFFFFRIYAYLVGFSRRREIDFSRPYGGGFQQRLSRFFARQYLQQPCSYGRGASFNILTLSVARIYVAGIQQVVQAELAESLAARTWQIDCRRAPLVSDHSSRALGVLAAATARGSGPRPPTCCTVCPILSTGCTAIRQAKPKLAEPLASYPHVSFAVAQPANARTTWRISARCSAPVAVAAARAQHVFSLGQAGGQITHNESCPREPGSCSKHHLAYCYQ